MNHPKFILQLAVDWNSNDAMDEVWECCSELSESNWCRSSRTDACTPTELPASSSATCYDLTDWPGISSRSVHLPAVKSLNKNYYFEKTWFIFRSPSFFWMSSCYLKRSPPDALTDQRSSVLLARFLLRHTPLLSLSVATPADAEPFLEWWGLAKFVFVDRFASLATRFRLACRPAPKPKQELLF